MNPLFRIRFQPWILVCATLLVVSLVGAFLHTVSKSFTQLSQETATARFAVIAERAHGALSELITQSSRFVVAQSHNEPNSFVVEGQINTRDLLGNFLSSLETNPTVYSHFFALHNDEFFQVIAIREDATIAAALKAPPKAWFAVRKILRNTQGTRSEQVDFLDARRRKIDSIQKPAELVPSARPWFTQALAKQGLVVTEPYLFASTQKLGITVAAPLPDGLGVIATDLRLHTLQDFLTTLALPPHGAVALEDKLGRILAFHGQGDRFKAIQIPALTPREQLKDPLLSPLTQAELNSDKTTLVQIAGEPYMLARGSTRTADGSVFGVTVYAPLSDFTQVFDQAKRDILLMSTLLLAVLLPLCYVGTRQIASTLKTLAQESERLKRLDFSQPPSNAHTFLFEINELSDAQSALHDAIRQRTSHLEVAQAKLSRLVESGLNLSREKNRSELLRTILHGAKEIAHCQAATLFLLTEQKTLRFALRRLYAVLCGT
ncbi:MAG: hypothetical protein Fur007_07200 [Rhodoferax sp.]